MNTQSMMNASVIISGAAGSRENEPNPCLSEPMPTMGWVVTIVAAFILFAVITRFIK